MYGMYLYLLSSLSIWMAAGVLWQVAALTSTPWSAARLLSLFSFLPTPELIPVASSSQDAATADFDLPGNVLGRAVSRIQAVSKVGVSHFIIP